ncbi:AI-2E family transporter [Pseudohalioglobus sediminis]|uniref:AI-2E family transporter n=1 Tax=Pseudohalioglobus sediminis TaxID=2606449 RepID=A0A5B0WR93_9GAMM|nr:AI-2E family transporter [Pseudohalioglobus sediminis]KAA1188439.1 AI-2E family transporter [Pseudohalioglobus sediminis]
MSNASKPDHPLTAAEFTDGLIRVGLILLMVVASLRVFSPFMSLMLWALILAVTLYPTHQRLAARLGGKQGRAATLLILISLLVVGIPVAIIGSAAAQHVMQVADGYQAGTLALRPPADAVAEWPLIGEQVYSAWSKAAANLPAFVEENRTTIESLLTKGVAVAKSTAGYVLMFIGALIVSGIMMAYGRSGSEALYAILNRLVGSEHGPRVHSLATLTTRSVAAGVLGVALIQGILAGAGFMLADVPAAGILAFVVLMMAIMQLPVILIMLPVIIWLWNNGDAGTAMNIVWTVYLLLTALADNVLKPMLLGRGVDAPMPVILIGALGGMISTGFVGLFVGAVVLAVGYRIFMEWVALADDSDTAQEVAEAGE